MFDYSFTNEEVAIILLALSYYQYENPHMTEAQFMKVDEVNNKIIGRIE